MKRYFILLVTFFSNIQSEGLLTLTMSQQHTTLPSEVNSHITTESSNTSASLQPALQKLYAFARGTGKQLDYYYQKLYGHSPQEDITALATEITERSQSLQKQMIDALAYTNLIETSQLDQSRKAALIEHLHEFSEQGVQQLIKLNKLLKRKTAQQVGAAAAASTATLGTLYAPESMQTRGTVGGVLLAAKIINLLPKLIIGGAAVGGLLWSIYKVDAWIHRECVIQLRNMEKFYIEKNTKVLELLEQSIQEQELTQQALAETRATNEQLKQALGQAARQVSGMSHVVMMLGEDQVRLEEKLRPLLEKVEKKQKKKGHGKDEASDSSSSSSEDGKKKKNKGWLPF